MSEVSTRLAAVQQRIADACARVGRSASSVELLAVSKLQSTDDIQDAYRAGQRAFGENYAQELRDKASELLSACPDIRWHAIGPLQLNKVKYVAKHAHVFHALDRLEIAQELSKRREGAPLTCYLEVNLAGETSKSGVSESQVLPLYEQVAQLPNLKIVGLMGLPPLGQSDQAARENFARIRSLASTMGLSGLSMGTTADFELAIECGATCVRVGAAIFKARETSPVRRP